MTRRIFVAPVVGLLLAAAPAAGQILQNRLATEALSVVSGVGTSRLDGMGLRLAAADENNEANLFDLGDNPAGLLADRDAWSLDTRWTHQERYESDPRTRGFNYNGNTYSAFAGFRHAGRLAIGGGYEFLDGRLRDRSNPITRFSQNTLRMVYNQNFGRLDAGLELRVGSESEDVRNAHQDYLIEHKTSAMIGIAGAAYHLHDYVTVAARGALDRSSVDGVSRSDQHEDDLAWDRPSGSAEAQLFVSHPRLDGGLVFGREKGAGEEILSAAWSPLFRFNPTNYFVRFESRTFTDEHTTDYFRTKWEARLIPDRVGLAASFRRGASDYMVRSDPVVVGSREASDQSLTQSEFGLGGHMLFLNQRLMLGAEYFRGGQKLEDRNILTGYTEETSTNSLNLGGEYLMLENLAARAGWGLRTQKNDDGLVAGPAPDYRARPQGTFDETTASVGLGYIPRGGILQVDAAWTVGLASDLDVSQNRVSLYARLLF